jgi:hypothetical protein
MRVGARALVARAGFVESLAVAVPLSRGARKRARILLALGGVVLGLLVLEGLVRLRQYRRYGTTLTTYYRMVVDPRSELTIPEPGHVIGAIRVNSLGFRGPEIERPKPPGRIRVAFLGGSTTFCAEASSEEKTWPHPVVEGLRADAPDLEFDFVNGGGAGYSTRESLKNLRVRIAPLEPDLLVIYHGTNDLTHDARVLAIEQGVYEQSVHETLAIGRWWLTWYLVEKNVRNLVHTRAGAQKLDFDPAAASVHFRERLTALVAEARARGPVALITFSHQYRREQPPEVQRAAAATSLYATPFLDVPALLDGFEEYNRVIREVARASGAILVEGETSIPGDERHFADSVHFRDPGLVLQAQRVLEALLAAPQYRALLASKRRSG